jgi:hypothetical protein
MALSSGGKDEFAVLSDDGMLYLGYCSRSSVVKIAEGFSAARGLMFDSTSDLYFVDGVGKSVAIPVLILLKNVLDSSNCPLKVNLN